MNSANSSPRASYEPQPDLKGIESWRIFKALGDPLRESIVVQLLQHGEMKCSQLCEILEVPNSTLSAHLKTLREAGVTSARKEGVVRWSSVRKDDLEEYFPGLLAAYSQK